MPLNAPFRVGKRYPVVTNVLERVKIVNREAHMNCANIHAANYSYVCIVARPCVASLVLHVTGNAAEGALMESGQKNALNRANRVKNRAPGVVLIINATISVVRNATDLAVMLLVPRSFNAVIRVLGYVEKIVPAYVAFATPKSFLPYLAMDMVRKWKSPDAYSCLTVVIL